MQNIKHKRTLEYKKHAVTFNNDLTM